MRIAIGADHGGFALKTKIVKYLKSKGHEVKDLGCYSAESCDYPKYGYAVAAAVGKKRFPRGVLICKSGIGMSIVANKVRGVRAALVFDIEAARSSREHNDANIIVFSARNTNVFKAKKILDVWLSTRRAGGRHLRRVKQISDMEANR
ncbi:MAG: ribose 5-phosphate isomerase B [Candidatus Omnitrophota bacterium]|jgi:ribose 5-phosphate isomerase B